MRKIRKPVSSVKRGRPTLPKGMKKERTSFTHSPGLREVIDSKKPKQQDRSKWIEKALVKALGSYGT